MTFRALHSLAEWRAQFGDSSERAVATIGNFDGVHLGHQKILRAVVERARGTGSLAAAITFSPHPLRVLRPAEAPPLVETLDQRLTHFAELGLDAALVLRFDPALASLSAEDFIRRILWESLRARAVIVGENFRFGHRQAGDVRLLAELGRSLGYECTMIAPVVLRGAVVSSTAIRQALGKGCVARAGRLLGRPFEVAGEIQRGTGTGRRVVVPTLNLSTAQELLPARGVYATETAVADSMFRSATNVGLRPTFDGSRLTIESHLFNFDRDLTSGPMRVRFWHRLRDERKFAGPDALRKQILRDIARAKLFFRRLDRFRRPVDAATKEAQVSEETSGQAN